MELNNYATLQQLANELNQPRYYLDYLQRRHAIFDAVTVKGRNIPFYHLSESQTRFRLFQQLRKEGYTVPAAVRIAKTKVNEAA